MARQVWIESKVWTSGDKEKRAYIVKYLNRENRSKSGGTYQLKKDADRRKRQIEDEIRAGTFTPDDQSVTFAYACRKYLERCELRAKSGKFSGGSLRNYRAKAKRATVRFGDMLLPHMQSSDIQQWIDDMAQGIEPTTRGGFVGRPMKRASISANVGFVDQVLNFAVKQEPPWLKRNPLKDRPVEMMGLAAKEIIPPTHDEMRAIFDTLRTRGDNEPRHTHANFVLMVTLGAFTGLRIGEVCGLQWENIDWEGDPEFAPYGRINVRHSYSESEGLKETKTEAGVRMVPLEPQVRAALEQHAANSEGALTGHVIKTQTGTPVNPTDVAKDRGPFPRLMRRAKLVDANGKHKFTFHYLRHFYVGLLIQRGVQAFHISKVVGHADIQTTMNVYGHLFPTDSTVAKAIAAASVQFTSPAVPALAAPTDRDWLSIEDQGHHKGLPEPVETPFQPPHMDHTIPLSD